MRPSKRNIIKMDVRKISVVCEDFKATEPNHNRDKWRDSANSHEYADSIEHQLLVRFMDYALWTVPNQN